MVRTPCVLYITLASALVSSAVCGDSMIRSVRVSSDSMVRIKPCEPAFVVLNVIVESSANEPKMGHVPLELARRIVINEVEYTLQFNANPVAVLSLNRSSVRQIDGSVKSFQVVAMLYWNTGENAYLFRKPDVYHVEFYPGACVDIVVEEPTKQERRMISEIEELGVDFAVGVMSPGDSRAKLLAPRIERMLDEYGDTAYARRLSIFLGTVEVAALRREAHAKDDRDLEGLVRRQLALATQYYGPYCNDEIESPLEAAARGASLRRPAPRWLPGRGRRNPARSLAPVRRSRAPRRRPTARPSPARPGISRPT